MNSRNTALILAGLAALGPFSIDTYFASFPEVGSHFGVTEIRVQDTLTYYLLALAGMNLFHGAVSDSLGRRRVILFSLGVYSISAFACVLAPSFLVLLSLRVVQGLAAGAGVIVGRAVIRDCLSGAQAHRTMAQVTLASGVGPVVAPILGGWLHVWFGWRGPFVFLGLLGVALWCACRFGLAETLPVHLRHTLHPVRLVRSYAAALSHPAFVLICLSVACGGGGFLLYVATAPDVVLNILKLSKTQFGWLFIPLVSGLILGAAASAKSAGRFPARRVLNVGFGLMALGAVANLVVSIYIGPKLPWAVLPLPIYTFGFSLLAPIATIQCLDLMPDRKGLASSLQGFSQTLVFAWISGIGARLVYLSGPKHACGLMLLMVASWLAHQGYRRVLGRHFMAPV